MGYGFFNTIQYEASIQMGSLKRIKNVCLVMPTQIWISLLQFTTQHFMNMDSCDVETGRA